MSKMDHVIVLMLENRSFDHLFGFLDHPSSSFPRLTGHEACPDGAGQPVEVSATARYEIPSPDHSHAGIMEQLAIGPDGTPRCDGFVRNFARRTGDAGHRIMRSFHPDMIPVLSRLAREFAVCTRWFASVPGETWPNREFVHSATSRGLADIVVSRFESHEKTVFELLDEAGATWRIYHDDTPHTWNYPNLWDTVAKRARFQGMSKLYDAIRDDKLPSYAFVEPDYGLVGSGNSQHPGQARSRKEFVAGELLIHRIYDALRTSPAVFEKTVFVITYDEHGGFYDHVPPPTTVSPDDRRWKTGFAFDRLGVRVPAVIVSPWIKRGTVDPTLYDHTSIIRTLHSRFASGRPTLTRRDAQANVFRTLLSEATPRRGAALPATRPLSDAQAAKLEQELAAPPDSLELPVEERADEFAVAMRELSRHVGLKLAEESAAEDVMDIDDPELVLDRFRRSADQRLGGADREIRRALADAASRLLSGGAGEGGGLEVALDLPDLDQIAKLVDATSSTAEEKQRFLEVLRRAQHGEALELADLSGYEAIILDVGREPVDIVDGSYATPPAPWEYLGSAAVRARLEHAIACVGRIEVVGGPANAYAGTGFLVGDDLVMTNRHVAASFADGVGLRPRFKPGRERVRIDFKRERFSTATEAFDVAAVELIHPHWDLALLRLAGRPPGRKLTLTPIDPRLAVDRDVVAIGYPARDPRNDLDLQARLFDGTYRVKRLSPGKIAAAARPTRTEWGVIDAMTHDCSTLGGNSGSALVDVATGHVIGLHLGGHFHDANFSCPAYELRRDPRIVAAGVSFTGEPVPATAPTWLLAWDTLAPRELARVATSHGVPEDAPVTAPVMTPVTAAIGGTTVRIPIEITVTVGAPTSSGAAPTVTAVVADPTRR